MQDKLKSVLIVIGFVIGVFALLAPITTYNLVTTFLDNVCFQCIIDNLKQ